MKYSDWFGCYANGWQQNDIIPEAFSHPAKFSKQLIRRIYGHLIDCGYVRPGDSVVDPFGGVALGALYAMRNGLHWQGLELEEKFVGLGCQNIELWNGRYAPHFTNWGTAELLQGDSRRLVETLATAGCVISSPPYASSITDDKRIGGGIDLEKSKHERSKLGKNGQGKVAQTYGRTPGQLGAMKEGDVSAVISSPPYADAVSGQGEGPGARYDNVYHSADNATKKSSQNGYGRSDGNLGNMAAVVGSPPFESVYPGSSSVKFKERPNGKSFGAGRSMQEDNYGQTEGNIGNDQGETFWTAAREIVAQCYQVLRPGGVAAFVTGDFVRNKKRIYFGKQWLALCESVGFEPLEWIAAWKQEPGPIQTGIFEDKDLTIDRVSFFRRLANEKAYARIHWESVDSNARKGWYKTAEADLWEAHQANPKKQTEPTDNKILDSARMLAWKDAGSPAYEESAAILNEDIIIVQKPGGGGPGVDGVVSSPPYADSFDGRQYDSKPREQREAEAGKKLGGGQINHPRVYGNTPGQLGSMKEGDPPETKDNGGRVNEEVMDLK